jgi:uncharacterized membrane protein
MSAKGDRKQQGAMEKIDAYFDAHPLKPWQYFLVGLVLTVLHFIVGFWLFIIVLIWLVWIGPRYLQRYNRKYITALGTLAYFLPIIGDAILIWLAQPGWILEGHTGGRYTDFRGVLAACAFPVIVYGLLVFRLSLYDRVGVKRHTKKDLFQ